MGVNIRVTSGPAIERPGDLAAILTNLRNQDILFIDEIHRLSRATEEVLYPAMEDFAVDIIIGKGPAAKSLRLNLPTFTLIGATTRFALMSPPLRERFGAVYRLDFYDQTSMETIVNRSACILGVNVELEGNTGTGDIEIKEANGSYDLNTGTGDIQIINSEGEFEINSGTGDVIIENSSGEFDANSGTGDLKATNITIEDEAELNSGTGEVEVIAPQGKDFDLSLNSGTDDATLDMSGNPIEGYFEFSVNARRGEIDSPIEFDEEDEYSRGNGDIKRKSFTRGKASPRYFISSGTGTARLKE